MGLLGLIETGEGCAVGGAGRGEGVGALAMGHAIIPIELIATPLLERGHNLTELGVDGAAVVALVVILDNDLPVRLNGVGNGMTHSQVCQRVAAQPLGAGAQC